MILLPKSDAEEIVMKLFEICGKLDEMLRG
jgi:hypothetical protein